MTRLRIGLVGLACAGTAAATGCSRNDNLPESCEDIQRDYLDENDNYPSDGEYTIYFDGEKSRPLTVWCENMNRDQPLDYLSVRDTENYSEAAFSSTTSPTGTTVTTSFERLRLDPIRLEIDPWDFQFATTRGNDGLLADSDFLMQLGLTDNPGHVPYGIAFRDTHAVVSIDAAAHIELVDTGLALVQEAADAGFFCLETVAPAMAAGSRSTASVSDDLSEATIIANHTGAAVSLVTPSECDDFAPGSRIALQYNGL
jgi:hypothetical protein